MKKIWNRVIAVMLVLCMALSVVAAAADSSAGQNPAGGVQNTALAAEENTGKVMMLKLNETQAYLNGRMIPTLVYGSGYVSKLIMVNGSTLLPLRFVCECLGFEVGYNEQTNNSTITDTANGVRFELVTGTTEMYKYDLEGNLLASGTATAPTTIIEGVTHVPVRSLLEAMGFYVYWDDEGYVLISETPKTAEEFRSLIDSWGQTGDDSEYPDTDNDGIPDMFETDLFHTDPNHPDTDGDGLPDGYEVYTLGTDPLKQDSDDNGVLDGAEDADEDGLTNSEEFTLGTDPLNRDTDEDGLTDSEEINTYHTDPLNADTDGDGLLDGEESYNGVIWTEYGIYFDPLNPDTDGNGTPDGEETFSQTTEKELDSHDSAVTSVSVDMATGGNLARNLNVESLYGTDALSSEMEGLVGDPVDFNTASDFEEATLTFHIDQTKLAEGVDFENLAVLWYDEANQTYELIPSECNAEESTVTAAVSHFSKYMVIDGAVWSLTWQKAPKYIYGTHMYAVFDEIPINEKTYCESLGGHSVTITSAEEQAHVWNLVRATGTNDAYWLGLERETDTTDVFQWITEEPYGGYSNWAQGEPSLKTSTWTTAKMYGPQSNKGGQWYTKVSLLIDGLGNTGTICEWESFEAIEQAGTVLDSDGDGLPDFMEKGGIPLPNGQIVYLDPNNPDTDGDGIPDGDEIALKIQIIDWDSAHNPIYGLTGYIFRSNPASNDSDGDGIKDKDDERAFAKDTIETMFKLSKKNSPRNPTYIEIHGNDITITTRLNIIGNANEIFPGTNKTYAQVAVEGIESIWTTTFSGGKYGDIIYDFAPGLKGTITTNVIYDTSGNPFINWGNYKWLNIRIDATDTPPSQSNVTWRGFGDVGWNLSNFGFMTLYKRPKNLNVPPYSEFEFAVAAAHEFGHTIGLGDAYLKNSEGKVLANNVEMGSIGIMYGAPYKNYVYSNDIEMILEAFSVNKQQYYFGVNKSRVVRLPQTFQDPI